ncbi:hypothetical protein YC2023_067738 [Brassica napus]
MEHFIQRWDVFKEADQATAREEDYLAIVLIKFSSLFLFNESINVHSLFPYCHHFVNLVWFLLPSWLFEHDLP